MVNIAIISTNKNKYSETFIHQHVKYLPFNIHYLFGGYLPGKYSIDKGVTEHEMVRKRSGFQKLFFTGGKEAPEMLKQAIKHYLQQHKIQIVLCEYGPSGVELMHICKSLNIPFIVHFHGYDAYRNDILGTYGKHYAILFKLAAKIVVVSDDMRQQILNLGCSAEKLRLIPYGVDVNVFRPITNSKKEYDFVFCGRFVDKKSPIQIIKSFKGIVKKNPSLKMVMIGEGELLNESENLCQQLGLSENIIFTGALAPNEVVKIYQQSKIFINHSVKTPINDSEGTPVSILEAMSSGLVVVATAHAGIKEVIESGRNGFLVNESDWQGFEKTLNDCILRWNELSEIKQQAILTIRSKYELSGQIELLANEIRMLANE